MSNQEITYLNSLDIIILQCGHIVSVADNNLNISTCPICGHIILNATKIQISGINNAPNVVRSFVTQPTLDYNLYQVYPNQHSLTQPAQIYRQNLQPPVEVPVYQPIPHQPTVVPVLQPQQVQQVTPSINSSTQQVNQRGQTHRPNQRNRSRQRRE